MANPIEIWEKKNPELFMPNNKVVLSGKMEKNLKLSFRKKHSRESVYRTRVISVRSNNQKDYVPICIPRSLVREKNLKGKWILLCGVCQTHRGRRKDGLRYKSVYVMVTEYYTYDTEEEIPEEFKNSNVIFLDGELCENAYSYNGAKVDLDVAVKRVQEKEVDCIPCIALGRAFEKTEMLRHGSHISFFGRFQSKIYSKKISEGEYQKREAYEIITWNVRL